MFTLRKLIQRCKAYGHSTCVSSLTICLKIFGSLGLGTRVLQWQQLKERHFVPYQMYITGAKFEYHYCNIVGDILKFVIHYSHLQFL